MSKNKHGEGEMRSVIEIGGKVVTFDGKNATEEEINDFKRRHKGLNKLSRKSKVGIAEFQAKFKDDLEYFFGPESRNLEYHHWDEERFLCEVTKALLEEWNHGEADSFIKEIKRRLCKPNGQGQTDDRMYHEVIRKFFSGGK